MIFRLLFALTSCEGNMKNRNKLFIVLLLVGFIAAYQYLKPIDAPYLFPVQPGTPEWRGLTSDGMMVAACQMPEGLAERMTTEALVETVAAYPLLISTVSFVGDKTVAYEYLKESFNGLNELATRPDAADALETYLSDMKDVIDEDTGEPALDFSHRWALQHILDGLRSETQND